MEKIRSRYWEAFREDGNLLGLTTAVAASAALMSPLPLAASLVAEAAYLLFVPDSRAYQNRLARRRAAETVRQRARIKAETLPKLDPAMQERFLHLESVRSQIRIQAQEDVAWFGEVLRKLDYLLEKFLTFAAREADFRRYLGTVWREEAHGGGKPTAARMVRDVQAAYDAQIESLQQQRDAEADSGTQAVLDKRIEVIRQRHDGIDKIGRILVNLQNQLALMEETFGLINDQIRARSPEQVLSDIEGVVDQTDLMTQMLEELAPYQQAA